MHRNNHYAFVHWVTNVKGATNTTVNGLYIGAIVTLHSYDSTALLKLTSRLPPKYSLQNQFALTGHGALVKRITGRSFYSLYYL